MRGLAPISRVYPQPSSGDQRPEAALCGARAHSQDTPGLQQPPTCLQSTAGLAGNARRQRWTLPKLLCPLEFLGFQQDSHVSGR